MVVLPKILSFKFIKSNIMKHAIIVVVVVVVVVVMVVVVVVDSPN